MIKLQHNQSRIIWDLVKYLVRQKINLHYNCTNLYVDAVAGKMNAGAHNVIIRDLVFEKIYVSLYDSIYD